MKFRENRGDNQDILQIINSLLARGDLFQLPITFANNLNPDQDRQNVGPDLDPNHLSL